MRFAETLPAPPECATRTPRTVSTSQLYGQCTRLGVYPLLGKVFSLEERAEPGLRLAFGQNSKQNLATAAERIAKSIEITLNAGPASSGYAVP